MNYLKPFVKKFHGGQKAFAVRASMNTDSESLAEALKLSHADGMLLLFGGASFMPEEMICRLTGMFHVLAEILVKLKTTVMDGGTNSGVMALMGKSLHQKGRQAPHIGVLPAKAEVEPGGPLAEEILEPHHSHFVLVDNDRWGSEVEIMNDLAVSISKNSPSLALLVNGGAIALKDIESCIKRGHELIIVKGSGRLADEIAEAMLYPEKEARETVKAIVQQGKLILYDLFEPSERLTEILKHHLGEKIHNESGN